MATTSAYPNVLIAVRTNNRGESSRLGKKGGLWRRKKRTAYENFLLKGAREKIRQANEDWCPPD